MSVGSDAAVQDDFGRAMEAHASGDHPAALAILLPLAEAGHPPSQCAVGDLYYLGEGVETDPERAADWIGLAAASSVPGALYQLGYMQLRGEGVAQDPIAAYSSMYYASMLGNTDATEVLKRIEGRLDPTQLAAAEELVAANGFQNPVLIETIDPEYPELARIARLEGSVLMQAMISTRGVVTDVEVYECSRPNVGFEQAAIESVSRWRYEPARRLRNGEPLDVYFFIFVDFKLH